MNTLVLLKIKGISMQQKINSMRKINKCILWILFPFLVGGCDKSKEAQMEYLLKITENNKEYLLIFEKHSSGLAGTLSHTHSQKSLSHHTYYLKKYNLETNQEEKLMQLHAVQAGEIILLGLENKKIWFMNSSKEKTTLFSIETSNLKIKDSFERIQQLNTNWNDGFPSEKNQYAYNFKKSGIVFTATSDRKYILDMKTLRIEPCETQINDSTNNEIPFRDEKEGDFIISCIFKDNKTINLTNISYKLRILESGRKSILASKK